MKLASEKLINVVVGFCLLLWCEMEMTCAFRSKYACLYSQMFILKNKNLLDFVGTVTGQPRLRQIGLSER